MAVCVAVIAKEVRMRAGRPAAAPSPPGGPGEDGPGGFAARGVVGAVRGRSPLRPRRRSRGSPDRVTPLPESLRWLPVACG